MKKNEAKFQIKFKGWLEANPPATSSCYELKWVEGQTFNINQWVTRYPHQLRGLLKASRKGKMCYHKISDASYEKKPFDCFVMTQSKAYLVVWFNKEKIAVSIEAEIVYTKFLTKRIKSATFSELITAGGCVIHP